MKNLAIISFLVAIFSTSAVAQQSETRTFESFEGITVVEGIEVVAKKGSKNEAKIKCCEKTNVTNYPHHSSEKR